MEEHSTGVNGEIDLAYDEESQTKTDSKGRKARDAEGDKKTDKDKRNDKEERTRKLEPSLKWKNLEIEKQKDQ